jgi:hypothetical protein
MNIGGSCRSAGLSVNALILSMHGTTRVGMGLGLSCSIAHLTTVITGGVYRQRE